MLTTEVTPRLLAAEILECTPRIMYFIRREIRRQLKGSSLPQVRVLAFLSRSPGATLSLLAESLGVTKATASNLTDKLVQRGWVNRIEDPNERRCVLLSLTEEGEKQFRKANDMAVLELSQILINVPPGKLRKIYEGVSALRAVCEVEI
ncbi:MAG: MarR family winged helix-turn-helix transcriptional regulator [Terriglobales bacterium]